MNTAKKWLDRILGILTAILFGALTLTVVWQVFARQVLQSAPAWTGEAANYLFVWTSMIAIAFVFGERGHMAVLFLVERFPRPIRYAVAIFVQLSVVTFAAFVMIWGGLRSAENAWYQNSTALPITIGPMYTVMPIAGICIIFYALHQLVEDLRGEGPLTVAEPLAEQKVAAEQSLDVSDVEEGAVSVDAIAHSDKEGR